MTVLKRISNSTRAGYVVPLDATELMKGPTTVITILHNSFINFAYTHYTFYFKGFCRCCCL